MAHLRDRSFGLPRIPGHRLAWLVAVPLLVLTLPARSGDSLDQSPDGAPIPATAIVAPTAGAPAAGVPAAPAVTPTAAIVTPEASPEPDDRQRRVLMLLLMNSAGPVRPYGNLGR